MTRKLIRRELTGNLVQKAAALLEPGVIVVKVQQAVYPSHGPLLVYDEERSVEYMGPASPEVKKLLGDELKQFFYARVTDNQMELLSNAPWQDW